MAADEQILADRELREDLAPFRNVADTGGDGGVGRDVRDVAALVENMSPRRPARPDTARSVVDFPAPLAPSKVTISPGATLRLTPSSARRLP